ncbi:MAG: hypothetical protein GEU80_10120 [Dehalococcoidia bacterium]|nr:hypothetical protein [Dehalococcoidia bacterium]
MLWLGGGQWSGKTSVARLLAQRYGLTHYSYDAQDAGAHLDRARQEPERFPVRARIAQAVDAGTFAETWVTLSADALAEEARRSHMERFAMVLDDIKAMPAEEVVLAEGWGLRPELIIRFCDEQRRAAFLQPTESFRQHQIKTLPRAASLGMEVSDPALAQQHRVERDRMLAAEVAAEARRLGMLAIDVDGSVGIEGIATRLEAQWAPFLPQTEIRP